ncbi:MAG: hypothetical protein CFK52_11030 [Chloracidobacterium sp. CP2_5A]|nr:MAG: hypothetical protein CFK52_11030 [Chloracidobacterium sp. CP2_5A]
MSEEAPSSFKISDRRLFNPDGTVRADAERDETEAPAPINEAAPVAPPDGQAAKHQPAPKPAPQADPLFSEFVLELATNAMMMLGLIEHPQYGRLPPDIEGGRHYIDILAMLVEKTKGNLAPAEERQLQETVASLRMEFVGLTKRLASNARKDI